MRISSLLKTEDNGIPDQVLQFILENIPENTEANVQAFLQLIVDLMGVDFIVTIEVARDPSFHRLVVAVCFNLLRTDYASKDFVAFHNFVTEIIDLAIENSVLELNVDWLTGSVKFLEALGCSNGNAQILVSLLSLPFLISFTDNFAEMRRLNLAECWHHLFENIKAGMRHSELIKKITEEMCALSKRCNIVNLSVLLSFHTEGLKVQHIATNLKILKNIKHIFHNELLGDEEKQIVADYFASSEPSLVLFHLMFEKQITIIKETFEVISYVHDYVHTIPSWTSPLYNLIYFKIFHRNQSIQILAADFFLKRLKNTENNDGQILIQILEFYFQYQPSMNELSAYIDNLWGFKYMQNFKNIFTLLREEATTNLLVCHFIISVAKKMQTNFDLYRDDILYLFKAIPLLLKDLQTQKYPFGTLLEIFIIFDVNLYSAELIGDLKYFERAAKILCETFLKVNHGYKIQSNIFYILDKFIEVEFCDITSLVCEIVDEALQMFETVFLEWEGNEFEINENTKTAIQQSVCNMYIIVNNSRFLDKENIRKVFKIMQKCFLERGFFQMFGYTKTRSIGILLTSELFKRIMLCYLQHPGEALYYIPILELKENAKQFMIFLEAILQRNDQNKYYKKTAYEALIAMMLLTQQMLRYNKNENLRVLCIDVTSERYLLILDFIQQSIHTTEGEYSLENQKNILRHFTELQKYHIGIPLLTKLSKIMILYGYLNDLENELFEVVKAILKFKTPTEEEGIRFSRLFPIIITSLVEQEKNKHTVEKILRKYLKLIEEHSSNKNEVVTLSILNVVKLLGQKLNKPTTDRNINRLKVLKYFAPFLRLVTLDDYKEAIKAHLPGISKHFTANESSTLKDFETTLLSKKSNI